MFPNDYFDVDYFGAAYFGQAVAPLPPSGGGSGLQKFTAGVFPEPTYRTIFQRISV